MLSLPKLMRAAGAVATLLLVSQTPAHSNAKVLPTPIVPDYQLGGSYPPPTGVNVVARDSTDTPAPGLFNICYVNGFQTQPGSNWPDELVVKRPDGTKFFDPNWPDEFLLDITSASQRSANLKLLLPAIKNCADKGFNAIEFDNLDSYTRSDGLLKEEQAIAFATDLVKAAAQVGLPTGQKNLVELGSRGRDLIGFSFVIAEGCHRWDECNGYTDVYGDQVVDIEYPDDLRGTFADVCADKNTPKATILRDGNLSPKGSAEYVYEACPQR